MARARKSALDTLYSRVKVARKAASKGRARWRQSTGSACSPDSTKKRPCLVTYSSGRGKRRISIGVKASRTAAFALPKRLASLTHLRGMPGVELPRKLSERFKFKKGSSRGLGRQVRASKGRASKGRRKSSGGRRKLTPSQQAARNHSLLLSAAHRISTGRRR